MFKGENIDYYTGFEGEPEIVFSVQFEQKTFEFKMWIGYFDSILSNVNLINNINNYFFYLYSVHEGWFDNSPYEIKDVNEIIEVFDSFEVDKLSDDKKTQLNTLTSTLQEVKDSVIEFLKFAVANECSVTISYE